MAQLVKYESNLLAVEVSLDVPGGRTADDPVVAFEVQRGDQLVRRIAVPPRQLGIPTDLSGDRWTYADPNFTVPDEILDQLQTTIQSEVTTRDRLLWLSIANPAGVVAQMPWERMLRGLATPVVRVPNFALHPPRDTDDLDVVVCVSQPEAKGAFDAVGNAASVINAFRLRVPLPTTIHVFADVDTQRGLQGRWPEHADKVGAVQIHDPRDAPPPIQGAGPDDRGEVTNPWLHWIAHEMAGRTVEAVHFLAHSYLARDQPALAIAESPTDNTDRRWARFVGPRQFAVFLDMMGAWAVGLSSPPRDFSPMGSRLFVHELSRERAGPIVHHPFVSDPRADALGDVYFSIFTGIPPDQPSDIALMCHPRLFPQTSTGDSLSYAESIIHASAMASLGEVGSAQPPWAILTRRRLEQSTAVLFPDTARPGRAEEAAGDGVREALQFVSHVIEAAAHDAPTDAGIGGLPMGTAEEQQA